MSLFSLISCGASGELGGTSDGLPNADFRVFITSSSFAGNMANGSLTGISGADKWCTDLAQSAGLTREYKAILSSVTDGVSAIDNLFITSGVYTLDSNGAVTKIVDSESLLFDADSTQLLSSISRDESGTFVVGGIPVWTGSTSNGTVNTSSCDMWDNNLSGASGILGITGVIDGKWLDNLGSSQTCNNTARIYCISQRLVAPN